MRRLQVGALPQIIALTLLVLVLLAGGALWFNYLGLIDATEAFAPVLRLVGIDGGRDEVQVEAELLLDQERLEKLEEALVLQEEALMQREQELVARDNEITRRQDEIEARERDIQDRENSFNERVRRYDNRREVLVQNSRDLQNMRPEEAVQILAGFDDQLLIDTLRVTEELAQEAGAFSMVPVWLARLPAERASEIQRKMTIRSEQ